MSANGASLARAGEELSETELALVESLETSAFLESILNASEDCIKVLDSDGALIFMNDGGRAVMEVDDFQAVQGKDWVGFWQGEDAQAASAALKEAQRGGIGKFRGFACTAKGTKKFWSVTVRRIAARPNAPDYILSISRDITAEKAAEDAKDLLAQELQHRVKNILAVAQAIGNQTFRQVAPDQVAEFGARIVALSRAQDLLLRASWDSVNVATVIRDALEPLCPGHQCNLELTDHEVEGKRGLAMALAIHELATNSLKYGALSAPAGNLLLHLTIKAGTLQFDWQESGGPPASAPTVVGFGTRLYTENLASAFGGQVGIEYRGDGLQLRLTAPS